MTQSAAMVWRDYESDGVPASGPNQPVKRDIRAWGTYLEALLAAAQAGGGVAFTTLAQANAHLTYPAFQIAWVTQDGTNSGVYQKQGASGVGSWAKIANLPYSFSRAVNIGSGSANGIVATSATQPGASADALIIFNATAANTSSTVTIAIDGASPLRVKTAAGNDPAIGAILSGMMLAGLIDGPNFRLVTDLASAAIQAAAEAAQAAAETARDLAIQAGNLAVTTNGGEVPYPSRALAAAATIPAARKYIIVEGYATWGDAPPTMYQRVATQPSHPAKFRSTDRVLPNGTTDATNGGWWEIKLAAPGLVLTPNHFGAPNDGSGYDDVALNSLGQVLALGICKRALFKGPFLVYATLADTLSSLVSITGVDGLHFEFDGATFTCTADQLALRSGSQWAGYFFNFTDCKNFRGVGRPKFIGNITKTSLQAFSSAYGMFGLSFTGNCSGTVLDGADGDGILCPEQFVCDTSTVKFDINEPMIVAVGGTGYTVGDVLTFGTGGGGATAATATVAAVSGGVITALSWTSAGNYPIGTLPAFSSGTNGYSLSGGTGSGARVYAYVERASDDEHTKGGSGGYVHARNCFYPYVQRDSGDFFTAVVDADYCYRSTFVYGGIKSPKIYTTLRHIHRTAVIFGGGFYGLGVDDGYFHVKLLPSTESGYAVGDVLCRPQFSAANPTRTSNHLHLDFDYGTLAGRAANAIEISKYLSGAPDDHPRGHQMRLKVRGRIKGKSDLGATDAVGTHFSMAGYTWTGDEFGPFDIALDIEGGGDVIVDPRPFPASRGGVHFDVFNPDGNVCFNNGLLGTAYKDSTLTRAPVTVTNRSRFLNRYTGTGPAKASVGTIDDSGTLTMLKSWHDFAIKTQGGTGATMTRNLAAAPFRGLRYHFHNLGGSTGSVVRVFPTAITGLFEGHAAGKYLDLALGATATIECTTTVADSGYDGWSVVGSNGGSLTYQA